MQDVQEIFSRVRANRKKIKDLRTAYKDALVGTMEYKDLEEKMKTLKMRRKQIEATIRENFQSEIAQVEDLKIDIESDMEMLNDIAVTKLMKGETLEFKDEYDNKYEPVFAVKFKKA